MVKVLNKIILFLKNVLLPILLIATIFIVFNMFDRLGKEPFGENFMEFLGVILPFIILLILNLINIFAKQTEVKENTFYNVTSLLVMIVICIFCFRALFDQNMYYIHKYSYKMNFNYFADQVAAIKVMLYGLSFSNILLMITNALKSE